MLSVMGFGSKKNKAIDKKLTGIATQITDLKLLTEAIQTETDINVQELLLESGKNRVVIGKLDNLLKALQS